MKVVGMNVTDTFCHPDCPRVAWKCPEYAPRRVAVLQTRQRTYTAHRHFPDTGIVNRLPGILNVMIGCRNEAETSRDILDYTVALVHFTYAA